ncbi:8-oxo-dGDP phosphatase NUDT18 isoform X1 [Daphnia magna]|uniref:8-oxo-dGDP phosphatase NUDT18 isoform X1 n=2 Tax=Daphnia magna TaxID=35525 RepID=UPI001E1BC41C|nr:8-oxo-dGDP phosphatase NUDT18 isoform X1 [Daphnia magna]
MENIEKNVILLLNGKDTEEPQDFCDFTLEDQNEAAISKGLAPSAPPDFVPILKQSVCYVVMAVIINEKNEILMMQEAKSSCAGQWYLPAGRVEPNESIMDAFKREVLEETGLTAEPSTLLMVESAAGSWYRFVLAGNVTGGSIKQPSQADSESLQAKWVQNLADLTLRAGDILSIVEHARSFKIQLDTHQAFHPSLLPTPRSYTKLFLRLIICARRKTNNKVHVLVSEKTAAHLPVCEIHPGRSLHAILKKFMTEMFGADLPSHRPHGVLALGHNCQPAPKITDGLCLTLLVSVRLPLEEVGLIDKYSWFQVNLEVAGNLLSRMGRFRTVPLNVVRTSESDA